MSGRDDRTTTTGSSTDKPLSIVHLIPYDGIGGVEVAARSMLSVDRTQCCFKLALIAGGALRPSTQILGGRFRSADNPLAQIDAVKRVLAQRPDVLICSLWRSVAVCCLVKLFRRRTALVYFLHLDRAMHPVDALMTWVGMRMADEIWSDSAETLAARKLPRNTPARVVSFVTQRHAPISAPNKIAPRFICWARLVPQKGLDRAIDLIGRLVELGVDARFDIWGPDGGARPALELQVERLQLRNQVTFRGPADHGTLAGMGADASFFLQLSRFEGMAVAAVEAMQLGLVPVTTAAGQMSRYVVDGITGILVDPDRLDVAAAAIVSLLSEPRRYAALRAGAIAYWSAAPLYADDICSFADALATRMRRVGQARSVKIS